MDPGLAAKARPCLILSDYPADDELALMVVLPHTTAVRGNRWELAIPKNRSWRPACFTCSKSSPFPCRAWNESSVPSLRRDSLGSVRRSFACCIRKGRGISEPPAVRRPRKPWAPWLSITFNAQLVCAATGIPA